MEKQEFHKRYVVTNVRADALAYSKTIVDKYLAQLEALGPVSYRVAVLAAMLIGAHRGDWVPDMFEEVVEKETRVEAIQSIFYLLRECVIVIWPFVGIPWCVPAALGMVNVLQRKGLDHIASRRFRGPMDTDSLLSKGKQVTEKTYARVNNPEVRSLLELGFSEMRAGITAVVWGYNIGGTASSGLISDAQVELLVATAIVAPKASRQSRSHVKACLGMGVPLENVRTVVRVVNDFASLNGEPLPNVIDVDRLAGEM